MSELRDALERTCRVLSRYASAYSNTGDPVLSDLLTDLLDVLRTTAGPSEMQQLAEWIDGMIDVDLSGDSAQQYGAHLVRDHIRTKFLGEEK